MKVIPEVTNRKSINTIFNDAAWIDALLVEKTPLSDALLKKAVKEMTAAKFITLHTWLRKADVASRPVDAANMVLGKVVDDAECQAIILSEKDYYTPMISGTVETASILHNKLRTIIKNSTGTDIAKFIEGIVKYKKET